MCVGLEAPPAATLGAWIDELAERHADRPALIYDDRPVSYASLAERSRRLAGGLSRLGIGCGDRVGLWLPNVPAWMEVMLACGRLGAIAVALNTRFRSLEVGDILERSGCRALVLWPDFQPVSFASILSGVAPEQLAGIDTVIAYGETVLPALAGREPVRYEDIACADPLAVEHGDPRSGCLIVTTSGTTSRPKFVLHSQGGLVIHAHDVAHAPGWYATPGSVGFALMPLCGAFGLAQTLAALAAGAPTLLHESFEPAAAAEAMIRHGVTNMGGVDEIFYRMLEARPEPVPFPALRCVLFGPFNRSPLDFGRIAEPRGIRGVGGYGMSEFGGFFSLRPRDVDAAERLVGGGRPVSAEARVRVRDVETAELLPPGKVGELEVAAPSMMLGYFGDDAATRAAFTADGYLRTGDSGSLEADGSFAFMARMGDALRLSGFLVSPTEIANHIETHPDVASCQVVGARGPDGMKPVAFVVPVDRTVRADELDRHCRRALAKYKVPVRFVSVTEFPVTDGPNGAKVQRGLLRERAEALLREAPIGADP